MNRFTVFTRAAGIASVLALSVSAVPAIAGKADQARAAIAEARGKIDAGSKLGTSGEAADIQSRAVVALQSAERSLADGKKDAAITDAKHASELADLAITSADKAKTAAAREHTRDAAMTAASADARADAAQQAAAAATADANARAAAAQQTAAMATAQADALRNAPPVTTVTTVEKESVRTPVRQTRKVVRKPTTTVTADKTTTTVSTTQP